LPGIGAGYKNVPVFLLSVTLNFMKNYRSLSAIGFCLAFIFILNIGVITTAFFTADHLLAAYAIGLSCFQVYLHKQFAKQTARVAKTTTTDG
jgi:hypothetical protein